MSDKIGSEPSTVDEIVDYFLTGNSKFHTDEEAVGYILNLYTDVLLDILKSKKNKSSKYDMLIISRISESDSCKYYVEILNIYKNRK